MNKKENQISSAQLMSLIISMQVGTGTLLLPGNLASYGHDGWIAVIIYGLLIAVVTAIIISLLKRYENQSIYGINNFLYGKYLGSAFNLLIVLYLWYSSCLSMRTLINILHAMVLRTTPSIILSIFVIIPTYYLTWYGLKYVARYSILIYVSLAFCYILFFLVFKGLKITFLMPVGESGIIGIKNGFSGCMYAFLGYEVIAVIYPEITNKQKAFKYSLNSILITTIFYTVVVLVITAFFGEKTLEKSLYPIFMLSRTYRVPVLERIDVLFLCICLPAMSMAMSGYFSVTFYSINKLLNLKKKAIYLILFASITIFLSMIPKSNSNLYNYNQIIVISGISFSIFLVLCYIFSFIRKRGVKKND